MQRLKQFIHEVHRRSLWQVLGIYVIGGWLVLQAVDTLAGALNLPEWAPPLDRGGIRPTGRTDVAFQWLERAYDSRSLSLEQVPSDPMFDPLREDPRFDELLARMGIETQPI